MTLYQNGNPLCAVTQFQYEPGQQEIIRINQIGGRTFNVPGKRGTDTVTFLAPVSPDLTASHQLVDNEKGSLDIAITSINFVSGGFIIIDIKV